MTVWRFLLVLAGLSWSGHGRRLVQSQSASSRDSKDLLEAKDTLASAQSNTDVHQSTKQVGVKVTREHLNMLALQPAAAFTPASPGAFAFPRPVHSQGDIGKRVSQIGMNLGLIGDNRNDLTRKGQDAQMVIQSVIADHRNDTTRKHQDVQMVVPDKVARSLENEFEQVKAAMNKSTEQQMVMLGSPATDIATAREHLESTIETQELQDMRSHAEKMIGHQEHRQDPGEQALGNNHIEEPTRSNHVSLLGVIGLVSAKIFARLGLGMRRRLEQNTPKDSDVATNKVSQFDVSLLICIALWYMGNYYYNVTNKIALNLAGGLAGFPMTIATLQLGVGVLYAAFLWIAPDARPKPSITLKDCAVMLPVGLTAALMHVSAVAALSAGAVSFAQIVKATEPAFAALLGTLFYGVHVSTAKWLCLIPVIGGVALASLGELNFTWVALLTAASAAAFAALNKNQTKQLMNTDGIKDRLGSVGNQFALTTIAAFIFCIPVMICLEGHKLGTFLQLCKSSPVLLSNVVFSGFWFYLYNELSTLAIKKTEAVTQSVLSALKRVIVIVVLAFAMGEHMGPLKLVGCSICIGGVLLYSVIDKLIPGRKQAKV